MSSPTGRRVELRGADATEAEATGLDQRRGTASPASGSLRVLLNTAAQWVIFTPPLKLHPLPSFQRVCGVDVRRNYLFQRVARHAPRSRLGVVVPRAETFFFFFLIVLHAAARGGLDRASRRRRPRSGRAAQLEQPAATEVVMGKEEEIARIARRLDKMVTRKSAVRGAGRQDPGAPAPRRPTEPTRGENDTQTSRDPCPRPALYLVLGLLLRTGIKLT